MKLDYSIKFRYVILEYFSITYILDDFLYYKLFLLSFEKNYTINTLRLRQNGRPFADDTFKHIFLNENVRI